MTPKLAADLLTQIVQDNERYRRRQETASAQTL
jgi:hypothetical protein